MGSKEGGTLITISGKFFSDEKDLTSVKVGGVDCKVQSATVDTITCVTGSEVAGEVNTTKQIHTGKTFIIFMSFVCNFKMI